MSITYEELKAIVGGIAPVVKERFEMCDRRIAALEARAGIAPSAPFTFDAAAFSRDLERRLGDFTKAGKE